MTDLISCPFCDGEPLRTFIRDGRVVTCKRCFAQGPAEFHGAPDQPSAHERADAAWNRRPSPPSPPAVWSGGDSLSQSQPSADAGTHIPRSPREQRLLALAEAYEPGNYALCDGVDHVYRNVSNCCQTLRDDIRWALGSGVPLDGGYTPEERRVSDYLLSITEGQIGSGLDPIGFLIASHAAINELRKEAEAALRAAPARLPDSLSVPQDEPVNSPSPLPRLGDGG